MPELSVNSIAQAAAVLERHETSAEEICRHYLDAIRRENPRLNAYIDVYDDAVEQARDADAKIAAGGAGPLAGIPLAVKDNILVRGRISTAGSKILETYRASYDATVISRLRDAGAVFLGKTNMDEFAMGSSTEHSAFGPTRNPNDRERVAGGSSGGSAAAVRAGLALGALGSDTGGSIRQPAAFCGVVGLKPTYGSVSRSGLIAMASSLDQIGPLGRTVGDVRTIFEAIRGHDPLDATTAKSTNQEPRTRNQKLIAGVPKEYFGKGLDPDVAAVIRDAIARCEDLGAEIREISLPHSECALAAYYIIMSAEASSNLARFDGIRYGHASAEAKNLLEVYEKTRAEGFGAEAKRRIMLGTYALSAGYYDAYYLKAQRVRRLIRDDFKMAFESVDFIIGPTTPAPAFKFGEKTADPLAMYLNDIYTVAVNLAGLPALSLPAGFVERGGSRLPVGLQIIGKWFTEDSLLDFAGELEAALSPRYNPDAPSFRAGRKKNP
ncbi:MAG: Asp-tRNA(Asn)/Glu-tRNA(Gln) amidotransferase subunit GatA [Candidatus Sungbacteria bacterium]|uniref:Glutamyl-tRNA(Gln) amidotransferase subunit A n=1 Tax=Candidatus Sungiibacteriota bacterium TaxID=2750080 RepID=A0A932YY97_9BACT|nr:Asp-tRNA(Asn)/Glu-tRNA(Gln) amidotransferase subunit GatA [Candidatus Sungbacteria bacterium]